MRNPITENRWSRAWSLSVLAYGVINGLLTVWLYWFAWPSLNRSGLGEAEYWAALRTYQGWLQLMILQGGLAAVSAIVSSLRLKDKVRKRWLVLGTIGVISQAVANFRLFVWDATGMGV